MREDLGSLPGLELWQKIWEKRDEGLRICPIAEVLEVDKDLVKDVIRNPIDSQAGESFREAWMRWCENNPADEILMLRGLAPISAPETILRGIIREYKRSLEQAA